MTQPTVFDRLLQRTLRLTLLVVLVLIGLLMWRLAVLVQRVERSVAAVNDKVEQLVEQVHEIGDESADAAQLDDMRHLFETLPLLEQRLAAEPPPLATDPAAEIDHLLERVRQYDGRFVQMEKGEVDDDLSPRALLLRLAIQRRLHEHEIATAEDFLTMIDGGSLTGDGYFRVRPDGARQPLADWLRQELMVYRRAAKPSMSGGEPDS